MTRIQVTSELVETVAQQFEEGMAWIPHAFTCSDPEIQRRLEAKREQMRGRARAAILAFNNESSAEDERMRIARAILETASGDASSIDTVTEGVCQEVLAQADKVLEILEPPSKALREPD